MVPWNYFTLVFLLQIMKIFNSRSDWRNYNNFKKSKNAILWTYEHEPMSKMEYFWASFDHMDGICYKYFSLDWIESLLMWQNILPCVNGWSFWMKKSWKMVFVGQVWTTWLARWIRFLLLTISLYLTVLYKIVLEVQKHLEKCYLLDKFGQHGWVDEQGFVVNDKFIFYHII